MKSIILNAKLGWRIEETVAGFKLYNEFGYAGTFSTELAAKRANDSMSAEPA